MGCRVEALALPQGLCVCAGVTDHGQAHAHGRDAPWAQKGAQKYDQGPMMMQRSPAMRTGACWGCLRGPQDSCSESGCDRCTVHGQPRREVQQCNLVLLRHLCGYLQGSFCESCRLSRHMQTAKPVHNCQLAELDSGFCNMSHCGDRYRGTPLHCTAAVDHRGLQMAVCQAAELWVHNSSGTSPPYKAVTQHSQPVQLTLPP